MSGAWITWLDWWLVAFPALLCVYVMLCAAWHVLRHESRHTVAQSDKADLFRVAVLVPARNEEAVLEECLKALLASDHPALEVHVLSDGSTDRTAGIAREFAGSGVRLHEFPENVGKSRALQTALDRVNTELVMVVDADTRLAPNAIRELTAVFADQKIAGATANIRVKHTPSLLTGLQAAEYASIIGLLKRANGAWGGLFTVSGAACCLRVSTLRNAGGFASPSITEDIELSWRLQKAGHRLVYVPRALAWVNVPQHLRALWQQRIRWSQGLTEVLRLHGNVWSGGRRALRVFAIESLLSMSWLILLAANTAHDAGMWLQNPRSFALPDWSLWHALSMTLFLCQSATAAVFDSHYAHHPWRSLPLSLLYPVYFVMIILPTSLIGWAKGLFSSNAGRWERSERA